MLEDNQVACVIRNESLAGAMGELPAQETWPEIWVLDDREAVLAKRLIAHALAEENQAQAGQSHWQCSKCGEQLEAQFTHCWRCREARSDET